MKHYRNKFPRRIEKLNDFYKVVNAQVPINITPELKETFVSVDKALSDACELALKQLLPVEQLLLMTDAAFRSAGYALMIVLNPKQKIQSERKNNAPVAFASNFFPYSNKNVNILERFLDNLHGISRVSTRFVGIIKADNRV